MARWKLACAHYLNVGSDSEWEYVESSGGKKGKQNRKRFIVPRFVDPRDPSDWTRSWGRDADADGEVVVCYEGKGDSTDIVFQGDPTPDMIPVDDEARAISTSFEERWRYKPEGAELGYSQSLIDEFQKEMAESTARPVEIPGLQDLAAAVAQMAQQNAELIKAAFPSPRKL